MPLKPPPPDAHWRDSARPAKFFVIDARAAIPVLFCLLHIRLWTIVLALMVTTFFGILNHYGFSLAVFFRWLRATLAGKRKIAKPWWV